MDKTDYERGWDDSIQYIREHRNAHSGTAGGIAIMATGGTMLAFLPIMAIFVIGTEHVNAVNMIITEISFAALFMVGFFVDKLERKSYKQRQKEFHDKWVPILNKEFGDK